MAVETEAWKSQLAEEHEPRHHHLLKAMSHPVRMDLLSILSYRHLSPAEFARERGEPVSKVAHHFRSLERLGCIEVVHTRPVRGSTEHFYRRSETIVLHDDLLEEMPEEANRLLLTSIIRDFFARIAKAMRIGTFTARKDLHFTWKPVKLDEQGWKEVTEILGSTYQAVDAAEERALERMEASGEEGFVATVALAAFESPPEDD
ncbi:MAG: ArsR/SmtB family transcription factor [Solirubrobacterales bacterium]